MEQEKKALEQALASYQVGDPERENAVHAAASEIKTLSPDTRRILARIEKRRWQRDNSNLEALQGYLVFVSGLAARRLERSRLSAAHIWERAADILQTNAPTPKEKQTVFLLHDLCRRAMWQYLVIGEPAKAKALATRALRYARSYVLWDTSRNTAIVLQLGDLAQAAVADNDHATAKAALSELIGLTLDRHPYLGDPKNFVFRTLNLDGRSWFQLSDEERMDFIDTDRILKLRDLGELYRQLAVSCWALDETEQALSAFDNSIHVLRWELSSIANRTLAVTSMLDAAAIAGEPMRQTYLGTAERELDVLAGHASRDQVKIVQDLKGRLAYENAQTAKSRPN